MTGNITGRKMKENGASPDVSCFSAKLILRGAHMTSLEMLDRGKMKLWRVFSPYSGIHILQLCRDEL